MYLLGLLSRSSRCRKPARIPLPASGHLSPPFRLRLLLARPNSNSSKLAQATENANVNHSQFIANADASSKWKKQRAGPGGLNTPPGQEGEFDNIVEGKGKLLPTSSHLFKLILPLGFLTASASAHPDHSGIAPPPPTVILLHPSQPLSHVARLVVGALAPAAPAVSFRSTGAQGAPFQWSDSTDLGDFIKDASRSAQFAIHITYPPAPAAKEGGRYGAGEAGEARAAREAVIEINVPTFADRTRYLKRRLAAVDQRLAAMEALKQACDREAHRGARRMAVGGLGALVVYWAAVARLTFWDYGWDVMEPVTYLSGLSTVVVGYLWFLYQGREVSYASVLDRSVSARREGLYKERGLDVEGWLELGAERRRLRGEIRRIAEDYDEEGGVGRDGEGGEEGGRVLREDIKTEPKARGRGEESDADKADRAERVEEKESGKEKVSDRADRAERHSKE
ncbi:DUF607-domain-containing protein [Athelia psychrophila]|uniref:Calcium uniporter protein, mitochondrial n=1 Tax=Athelia psychrophila TaxID=1759441 RepID=A0A166FNI5_9AGAM|nr:DUF607-domain-containing protein [Fibularhizoctonia sp. CBS 109695]